MKKLLLLLSVGIIHAAQQPNIIVILSDDHGYNELSLHGNKDFPTPHIDALAASGARFTNGYASGCVCSPTRAGMLVGKYQQKFGHEFNIPPAMSKTNGLPLTETLFPSLLKNAGYRTIAIGKWHLGYDPKFQPLERGFTDFYGFLQGARSYFPLSNKKPMNGLMHDKELIDEKFTYLTDHLTEKTCDYIKASKEKPFFIYLAYNATHGPHHASPDDLKKAAGNKKIAMTIALDRGVGKITAALKENNLTEKTLVFFVNDNGGATGRDNTPLHGHKGSTYEGGVRVPYIISQPGKIPAGKTYADPVITLDIAPTILAAANLPASGLDGVNLLPLVEGKEAQLAPRALYWKNGSAWAIREGNFKLVGGNKGQKDAELFDLVADIGEKNNIAAKEGETVTRLKKTYDAWQSTHKPTAWGSGKKKGK